MKQTLIILVTINCLLCPIRCSAQLLGQARIDSLLNELPKQNEDINKVKLLNEIVYETPDNDTAIKYGQQALKLATRLSWKKGMAYAYSKIGQNYGEKNDPAKALTNYVAAAKIYDELNDKVQVAGYYSNIGFIYINQGDFANGLDYFFKSERLFEELGDTTNLSRIVSSVGRFYMKNHDYPKALDYSIKALKMGVEMKDTELIAFTYMQIGSIYEDKSDYAKALEYDFMALKLSEEYDWKDDIAWLCGRIGSVYRKQHDYSQAVVWHFKAMKVCKETADEFNEAGTLGELGMDYLAIAKDTIIQPTFTSVKENNEIPYQPDGLIPKGTTALLHKSVEYLNKGIAGCWKVGRTQELIGYYKGLSTADSMLGDIKGAYYAHLRYIAIRDSFFSKESAVKVAMLEVGRKAETDSLQRVQEAKVAELKYKQQQSYTYGGIAGMVALLVFSLFIIKERRKSDKLLLNILPPTVANELKSTGATTAKHYNNITVMFTDFVDFTQAGEQMSPQSLIDELHACFKKFDEICDKYSIEKIKTIGDAYLAVAGLPTPDAKHAEHIVAAAKEIAAFMEDRLAKMGTERTFQIRVGIHSGSVVAGIVGVKKFAYDIWGDTVNTAARMEQNSEAGKINISQTTYELVKDKFACEYRGEVAVKGKGMMKMYYISTGVGI